MKRLLLLVSSFAFIGCASTDSMKKTRYVCQCDSGCTECTKVSDKPGKCECGKPLVAE